jgi:AGZA family xanthine/uracil permease-like MFS transporter
MSFFKLAEHQTTISRELQAGFATFAAMAYILAVNPLILANAGMDKAALVTVTALTAAIATSLMGLLTNYPLAMAPGMGINAFFAFTICLGAGIPWSEALGMVFVNGLAFLVLSLTGVREALIAAIPGELKIGITCGIGLFIAFIGLKNAGAIVASPATFVTHGDFSSPPVVLFFCGLLATGLLVARQFPGAIVLGMLGTTLVGLVVPSGESMVTVLPNQLLSLPASPEPVFLKLSFGFLQSVEAFFKALPLILTLLLVDMFDNIGTLIGVTRKAGLVDSEGRLPGAGRALIADSIATILSALCGTSTVVSYIESAAGVGAGGRTGLTALTVAGLMLVALFLTPVILAIPAVATAPALVVVGVLMMQSVGEVDLKEFRVAMPVVLTLIGIPLTFSIAEGIGIGLVCAAVLSVGGRRLSWVGYGLAVVFGVKFLLGR